MAKDYTSLLGKSSGSSWGDIAGAYFAGTRKKDNKAINILLGTLFFNAKEANMQSKVLKNLQELEDSKALEIARAKQNFKKKVEIEELQKRIEKEGAYTVFDSEAEAYFNNPNNQAEDFDPLDFEDKNSPMYGVKRKAKNRYIDEVLLPKHNAKYGVLDKTITTEEEFIKPIQDRFKSEMTAASAPGKVSLVHSVLNKIGIGGSGDHIKEIEKAKKVINENKTRRTVEGVGYIFDSDFDDKYYLKSSYLNPENGQEKRYAITEAELLRGSKYSLNEFKRSEEYNTLQTPGAKSAAIQMFNEKSKNGLLNDEHLLDVINTAKVTDVINTREITFNTIKNNDPDFIKSKPQQESYTNPQEYEAALETWQTSLNEAYSPGGAKYLQARKDSGYMVTELDKYRNQISQYIEYESSVIQERQMLTDDDGVFSKEDQKAWIQFKNNKINKLIEDFARAGLETPSSISKIIDGVLETKMVSIDTFLNSEAGIRAIEDYQEQYELNTGTKITFEDAKVSLRNQRYSEATKQYNEDKKNFGITAPETVYSYEDVDLEEIANQQ